MQTKLPAVAGSVERGVRPLVEKRTDGYWLTMPCNNKAWCEVPVTTGPACENDPERGRVWHWDGNAEAPTITPSVGCDNAPRCGQHRVITAGKW